MVSKAEISREYFNTLELSLKVGCSINCWFCPQKLYKERYFSISKDTRHQMTTEDFLKIVKNLSESKVRRLLFSGYCENFLNPKALEIISIAKGNRFQVSIITTGVGLKKEDILSLSRLEMDRVTVSLDPSNSDIWPIKGNISERWRNITYILENIKNTQIVIVAKESEKNSRRIIETENFCLQNKLKYRIDLHNRAGNLHYGSIIDNSALLPPLYCSRPMTNVVQPNGDLSLCCMDWSLQHILGNLYEQEYNEIIENAFVKNILENLYYGAIDELLCKHCHYLETVDELWTPITVRRSILYGKA